MTRTVAEHLHRLHKSAAIHHLEMCKAHQKLAEHHAVSAPVAGRAHAEAADSHGELADFHKAAARELEESHGIEGEKVEDFDTLRKALLGDV